MRAGMLALPGGVIILYCIAFIPPYWLFWIIAALILSATLAVFKGQRIRGKTRFLPVIKPAVCYWLAVAALLLGLVAWQLERALAVFNTPLPQEPLSLQAYPCAPGQWREGQGLVLTLCITKGLPGFLSGPIPRLRGTLAEADVDDMPTGPHRFSAQLTPLQVAANPGQFRGEAFFLRQGLIARSTLEGWQQEPLGDCQLHCRYHSWRLSLLQRLRQHLPAMAQPGLVEALALGSRARLTDSHWQTLQATGTNHLVAISGLHLGMVAIMVGWLSHWLLLRFGGQAGPWRPWLMVLLVMAGSGAYALLAGFTVPTRRALVMVVVASVAVAAGRRLRAMDGWLLALLLVLLLDPLSPLDMGFWLSFAAVACLLLVFASRLRQPPWWQALLLAQLVIMIGLWPMLAAFDRSGNLMALVANSIAIPVMSLVLMPLLLISLPLVLYSPRSAAWVEPGLALLIDSLWSGLVWLGERSVALPPLPMEVLVVLAIAILLASFPMPRCWRGVTLSLVLSWLVLWPWQVGDGNSENTQSGLLFIDSPGVSAVLFQVPGKTGLYVHDPRSYSYGLFSGMPSSEALPRALTAALVAQSVSTIDVLVISHSASRQLPAWEASQFKLSRVIAGGTLPARTSAKILAQSPLACKTHDPIFWNLMTLTFWQDPRQGLSEAAQSCVVRIESPLFSGAVLLSGSIGREGERRLLSWLDNPASISGLLAPAGGDQGSSQAGWVQQLDPQWVIFSAPPDPDVLKRYLQQGSVWWHPGQHGAVTLTPKQTVPEGFRQRAPFWWRRPSQ